MSESMSELTRSWQEMLLPWLWTVGAAAIIFGAMGYASWRALRVMPDFPEKAAMLRGAKWGGLAIIALSILTTGVALLCAGCGLVVASLGLAKALLWTGFAFLLHRFQLESDGILVGGQYWLRYRRSDPGKWLEDWRSRQPKAQRYYRIMIFVWPVLILGWLSMAAWGYWHFDRMFLASTADDRLGIALKQELGDARVVEVAPMAATFEGPLIPLNVYVAPDTEAETGRQLAERLLQILAERRDGNAWRIRVRPKFGHVLAQRLYAPPGVVLPPGIERQTPRPRDW